MISLLALENALKSLLSASDRFDCALHAAHAAEVVPETENDWMQIAAGNIMPTVEGDESCGESLVEFHLFIGGITDADNLAAITAKHDERVRSLAYLLGEENITAALASLNEAAELGFSGWMLSEDQPEDARSEAGQLLTRRIYRMEVFNLD